MVYGEAEDLKELVPRGAGAKPIDADDLPGVSSVLVPAEGGAGLYDHPRPHRSL